jgi:hypothetical protein
LAKWPDIFGDLLEFVLATTGHLEPSVIGLDPTIDVCANEEGSSARPTSKRRR